MLPRCSLSWASRVIREVVSHTETVVYGAIFPHFPLRVNPQGHSVFGTRACWSFPSPCARGKGLTALRRRRRARGEGGGVGRWCAQAVLLPTPSFPPARGEGVEGPGSEGKIEN